MWYRGSPNQRIIVQSPGREPRELAFDEDGYCETDSSVDHLVLTGYASAVVPGRLDAAHATACLDERPGEEERAEHARAHAGCDCGPECTEPEHGCCGLDRLLRAQRAARRAAIDAVLAAAAPSEAADD